MNDYGVHGPPYPVLENRERTVNSHLQRQITPGLIAR